MSSTDSFMVLNKGNTLSEKTVVVLGCPRGGTSMLAGVLRELEIPMGERINPGNHEDTDFLNRDIQHFKNTIAERNRKYGLWGWKVPDTIHFLDEIIDDLRNPHFIVIYRNLFSVADSITRYHEEISLPGALEYAESFYTKINSFISTNQFPMLLVNFERALMEKTAIIDNIVQFLSLQADSSQTNSAESFISEKKGYQQVRVEEKTDFKLNKLNGPEDYQSLGRRFIFSSLNLVSSGTWQYGIHSDPQMVMQFLEDEDPLPSDFIVKLSADWKGEKPNCKLYLDTGLGFSEAMQGNLDLDRGENYFLVESSKPIYQVRIDPAENEDHIFLLSDLDIWEK